ncbi:hypothetical protein SAMN04515656_11468 [Eubacterium aggregans]|uniref:Uncharacterized protein n=1 Tax=Eubacterium aggregans TaxID=81409 RepID=A0A1H4CA84_9FIRM|nr:hypothetical protein [Eubacterium aggregans]SEA57243.1 hypothetical protein SAMN04515656_11468 [Eubacterium aggregans]
MKKRIIVKGDYEPLTQNIRIALLRVGFKNVIFEEEQRQFTCMGRDGLTRITLDLVDAEHTAIVIRASQWDIKQVKEGLILQSGNPLSDDEVEEFQWPEADASFEAASGLQSENDSLDIFAAVEAKADDQKINTMDLDDGEDDSNSGIVEYGKKPFYKKWWFYGTFILIIGVGAFVWTALSRGNTNQPAPQPTVTPVATATPTADPNVPQAYTTELTSGDYSVGMDIPVGVYQMVAASGRGTIDTESDALSEAMTMDSTGSNGVTTVEALDLVQGDILKIRGTLQLKLESEAALVNARTKRKVTESTHYTLDSGFSYQSGVEFPAGTYNLKAIRGSGVIRTAGEFSVTENMGSTEDRTMVTEMKNIQLPQGTTLFLEGVSVELIPVGE